MFRHGDDLYLLARRDVGGPYERTTTPTLARRAPRPLPDRLLAAAEALRALQARPPGAEGRARDGSARRRRHAFPSVQQTGPDTYLIANYTSPLDDPDITWLRGQTSARGTQIYLLDLTFVPYTGGPRRRRRRGRRRRRRRRRWWSRGPACRCHRSSPRRARRSPSPGRMTPLSVSSTSATARSRIRPPRATPTPAARTRSSRVVGFVEIDGVNHPARRRGRPYQHSCDHAAQWLHAHPAARAGRAAGHPRRDAGLLLRLRRRRLRRRHRPDRQGRLQLRRRRHHRRHALTRRHLRQRAGQLSPSSSRASAVRAPASPCAWWTPPGAAASPAPPSRAR